MAAFFSTNTGTPTWTTTDSMTCNDTETDTYFEHWQRKNEEGKQSKSRESLEELLAEAALSSRGGWIEKTYEREHKRCRPIRRPIYRRLARPPPADCPASPGRF